MMEKEKVPIYQKINLTIEEAAEYSNIGVNKLREIIKVGRDTSKVLFPFSEKGA